MPAAGEGARGAARRVNGVDAELHVISAKGRLLEGSGVPLITRASPHV
jgi:hypothetical protein